MSATVVTGIGVIAPTGNSAEQHWESVLAGRCGIRRISKFEVDGYATTVAGEVAGFDPEVSIPARLIRETDRMTQLAFAATDEALADAEVDLGQIPDLDLAVITASSSGGVHFGQSELQKLYREGPLAVGAYMSIAWFYAASTGQLSIRHGMRGSCGVMVTEQASGLDALGHSRRALGKGMRLALTGGTDASLAPYGLVAQLANGMLSRCPDPGRAFRPFDAAASGYVPGEGGAMLVVEEADVAASRGVDRCYGELAGYAATTDPRPGSSRPPGLRRAIELALADAGVRRDEVDAVFADGYGVPEKDRQEAEALTAVFGPRGVPVTAPKTLTGRMYAGGAAVDAVTALLALRDQVIPHTAGIRELAPGCDIDLVTGAPRETRLDTVLVLARGYGGFNAAVVFRRAPAPADRRFSDDDGRTR